MASHHHNHDYHRQNHHQQRQQQNNYPTCHCCCCTSPRSPPHHHPSPICQSHHHHPSSYTGGADPLLVQEITTQILQSSPNPLLFSQFLQPHKQPPPQTKQQSQHYHHHQQQEKQTRSLLTSLHRRIDALESSLRHLSSSSPSLSPPPPLRPLSLRDLAARTIQTHFRAFLVKRSRTLRHLKDLAFIKSSFNSLKSSLSSNNNAHLDQVALSQKAMDLLLKLDSVQGGDPMIRDGKRSISRELVRFLEIVDRISVKGQQISSKAMKNVRLTGNNSNKESRVFINSDLRDLGNKRVFFDKLNNQGQETRGSYNVIEDDDDEDEEKGDLEALHPVNDERSPRNHTYEKSELYQARNGIMVKRPDVPFRSKKSVSFADNGKVSRVFISTQDSDEDDVFSIVDIGGVIGDDRRELVENLCREVEELEGFSSRVSEEDSSRVSEEEEEEEAQFEDRGIPTQFSDGERNNPREYLRNEVVNHGLSRQFQCQNGNFVFSPPVPVKMESRVDDGSMKRKQSKGCEVRRGPPFF